MRITKSFLGKIKRRIRKAIARRRLNNGMSDDQGQMSIFECSICGEQIRQQLDLIMDRETPSCTVCGSNARFRTIAAALSRELLGEAVPLTDLRPQKHITGIGLSDTGTYADVLDKVFSYTNTFYHQEPRLDITNVSERWIGSSDFLISSDVFEHIAPPVDRAFQNMFDILKPGGLCVFSVPYKLEGETDEHFPEIHDYEIRQTDAGYVLINRTVDGRVQEFTDLVFHGGPGETLEMRLFSLPEMIGIMESAGFVDIRMIDWSEPHLGVINEVGRHPQLMTMRKPSDKAQ